MLPSGTTSEALHCCEKVTLLRHPRLPGKPLKLNPSSAEAHHLLGVVYFKEKKPDQAADAFTRALKLKPAYPDALNDLAEVYRIQGKSAEAEQALRRAIEIDPRHADSYIRLSQAV